MRSLVPVLAGTLFGVALVSTAAAQNPPPASSEIGAAMLALTNLPAKGSAKLTVTSPAFKTGGDIPFENTQYRGNAFPGLAWTSGPRGTRSYAVIMQDADAMRNGAPILHWTMINIPATVNKLDPGMQAPPTGALNGPNMRGAGQAYLGPRTPASPKHRYHVQVFALDATLSIDATADYAALTTALQGHVLASGEIIGLGQAPPPPQ